jgi:SnoaL-like domain
MRNFKQLANNYIALWNETDQARRLAILADSWTKEATYIDPVMRGKGHSEINALVGAVHAKFPGFAFSLIGSADGHGDNVRFSWSLGPKDSEAVIKGSDFVTLVGDHIATVTGFLDLVPASA